jgi:hypothetical protein
MLRLSRWVFKVTRKDPDLSLFPTSWRCRRGLDDIEYFWIFGTCHPAR